MENSKDWENLSKIGEIDPHLMEGADSKVQKFSTEKSNMVLKEYEGLHARYGQEKAKNILEKYYADTEKAQLLLEQNPNPLNQHHAFR